MVHPPAVLSALHRMWAPLRSWLWARRGRDVMWELHVGHKESRPSHDKAQSEHVDELWEQVRRGLPPEAAERSARPMFAGRRVPARVHVTAAIMPSPRGAP